MVYARSASQGRAHKNQFDYILRDISKPRPQNRNREQPIPSFGTGGGTVAALILGLPNQPWCQQSIHVVG